MSPVTIRLDAQFGTPYPRSAGFDTDNDLQLPIGVSIAFQGAIAPELALAQRIVELKRKIDFKKE